jgi:hypothetical protein
MGRRALKPPKELLPDEVLQAFLSAATTRRSGYAELSAHLYAAFEHWCGEEGIKPAEAMVFGRKIGKTKKFESARVGAAGQKAWRGVRLKPKWKKIAEMATERRRKSTYGRSNGIAPKLLASRFLIAATEPETSALEPFSHLFAAFREWCTWMQAKPLGRKSFGEALTKLRITPGRMGHGGQKARRGIRLQPAFKAAALSALARG